MDGQTERPTHSFRQQVLYAYTGQDHAGCPGYKDKYDTASLLRYINSISKWSPESWLQTVNTILSSVIDEAEALTWLLEGRSPVFLYC